MNWEIFVSTNSIIRDGKYKQDAPLYWASEGMVMIFFKALEWIIILWIQFWHVNLKVEVRLPCVYHTWLCKYYSGVQQ